jgi:hypothetical protein
MGENEMTPAQEEWLAALESGQYQQTSGHLTMPGSALDNTPEAHCCMGVMCVLAKEKGVITEYTESDSFPPPSVCHHFGLIRFGSMNQRPFSTTGSAGLALLNDVYHRTFKEIAAEVRASPERFFICTPSLLTKQVV